MEATTIYVNGPFEIDRVVGRGGGAYFELLFVFRRRKSRWLLGEYTTLGAAARAGSGAKKAALRGDGWRCVNRAVES